MLTSSMSLLKTRVFHVCGYLKQHNGEISNNVFYFYLREGFKDED